MKVGALALLFAAGCPRPLTPTEQEIGLVALVAERQPCVSTLRISRPSRVYHYVLSTFRRDGSVSHPRSAWYDLDACGGYVQLHTLCSDHLGKIECSFDVGEQEQHRSGPPPRSPLVAEVIAVFDHAQPLFSCSLLDDLIRLDRRADGPEVAYEVEACGIQRAFRVTCPAYGSIDPDDCHVTDRER